MVISTINELLNIAERLKFNEKVNTISNEDLIHTCFSTNELPIFNLNRNVLVVSDTENGTARVVNIDGRVITLNMPVGWTDTSFRIISNCPYVYTGTIKDVIKQLTINKTDANKYPFVAFVLNFSETTEDEFVNSCDIRILIANVTNASKTTIERQGDMDMLRMIANNLIKELNKGNGVILPHYHKFDYNENYLMSNLKAVFSDYVDAIEMKTTIKLINKCY